MTINRDEIVGDKKTGIITQILKEQNLIKNSPRAIHGDISTFHSLKLIIPYYYYYYY